MVKTRQTFTVSESEAGQRLDRLLVLRGSVSGRRQAARLFSVGAVRVNGRRVAKAQTVVPGDAIAIELMRGLRI